MLDLDTLVGALGGGLLRLLVAAPSAQVDEVVIAEPGDAVRDLTGDLVFGAGVTHAAAAVELVERAGRGGAAGVVLRRGPARARGVRTTARRHAVALLELDDAVSLVHVIGLVRGILDQSAMPGLERPDVGGYSDLLAFADAAAALVDAPVTIEDAQSRVLAHSARQDVTDAARVSTIVGRRVPAPLIADMRSRGVFRKLARSAEPFMVAPGPGQEMPRFVVPVRAGGEWLGSIWAVVAQPPSAATVLELRQAATVVALHLIRLRALTDLGRRITADRVRGLLMGGPPSTASTSWLPPGPWRVVALSRRTAMSADDLGADLDLWESVLRRWGWRQPLVADLDDHVYVVVQADGDGPGSWRWLASQVRSPQPAMESGVRACAGSEVGSPAELVDSRAAAAELGSLADVDDVTATVEDRWVSLAAARAVSALGAPDRFGGPVPALREHDGRLSARRSAYLPSLAAWLDHPGEPGAAAQALGVHVNTLRHRMVRMSEVADLPLHDPAARTVLRLQLAALGY